MTFTFPAMISAIPVAISLGIILLGLFLWRKTGRLLGVAVVAGGALFGVLFGPMLFMDRVVIDDVGIEQTTGFWFAQTRKGFEFEDLESLTISSGRDLRGRPRELWIAEYRSGQTTVVDPGDLWESNGEAIIDHLRTLEIRVNH